MTTQVVFNIDKRLKERAMTKARREGVTLSLVLTRLIEAYVAGEFRIGIIQTNTSKTKVAQKIKV